MGVRLNHVKFNELNLKENNIKDQIDFSLFYEIEKEFIDVSDTIFICKLYFSIKNTIKNPFPFDINVIVEGEFIIEDTDIEKIKIFKNIQSIQMLFPYLRQTITQLTTLSMRNPLVIPISNVNDITFKK